MAMRGESAVMKNRGNDDGGRILDVLIATHGPSGLERVAEMALPEVACVGYVVTWQLSAKDSAIPAALMRRDVEIHKVDSVGSSSNHNDGIALSKAPYCLFADNDLDYTAEGLTAVMDSFRSHPDVDIATFRHDGEPVSYPAEEIDFTDRMPKGYSVATYEIAARREAIKDIRFDPNFGVAAPLAAIEDGLFIHDCRRAGLRCRFFPVTIVTHKGISTGYRKITDCRVAMAEGAYIRIAYGWKGYPRVPLFAWRAWRSGRMSLVWGIYHLTRGFFSKYVALHRSAQSWRSC